METHKRTVMFPGIKAKVLIAIGTALIVIGTAALLTFFSLQKITGIMEEMSRPDERLAMTNRILSDISQAEASVRAYSVSKDESHLEPYFRFASTIEQRIDSLHLPGITTKEELNEVAALDSLVDEKFMVFSEFVDIKNSEKVQLTLKNMAARVESSPGKNRFLDKIRTLLGADKKEKQNAAAAGTRSEKEMVMLSGKELELLQRDESIMKAIRSLVISIENREREFASGKLEESKRASEKASAIIIAISVASTVVMVALVFFIFTDISRSNRYRKELEEAKEKAEKLAKVKEEFLANMSHEIRTPLNAIIGFSDQLRHTHLEKQQKDYLEAVRKSSEHLLRVVNDILDFSKIEAGKLKTETTGFRPVEVVGEVIATMKSASERKKLQLGSTIDEELKDKVLLGDPFRIKQVLLNLLNNGIKFTPEGQVWLSCRLENSGKDNQALVFEVSDTGIGIAADKLESIFEEFTQADSRITRKFGGTGLGLAICRKLVELQGGQISAKSSPGKGSVFSFSIPCRRGTEYDLPSKKSRKTPEPGPLETESKRVLVVDDDEMNRLLAKTILNKYKLEIEEAADGKQALEMMKARYYDLVLADIQMPEMSGIEVAKHIRGFTDRRKLVTPIIALTANILKEDISRYLAAGMNDYILKPFREEEFISKVFRSLDLESIDVPKPKGLALVGNGRANGKMNGKNKAFSLEELQRVAEGDRDFIVRMIHTFITNTRANLNYMKEQAEEKNWENIGKAAHKMAPSCDNLKVHELYSLLRNIERKTLYDRETGEVPGLLEKAETVASPVIDLLEQELERLKT